MLSRDDIIEAASKAGFETKRDMIWVDGWEITPTLTRFAALVAAAERSRMISEGWRQCAQGQRATQFCGMVEQERTRACRIVTGLCISDNNAREINEAIRMQATDRLARHGINPCPDCHGVGYDASGQLCWCQQNPSF
jgi:hypothetical protein